MQKLKRVRIKPVCVVVSQDVMYDIKISFDGSINPYSPYFHKAVVGESKDRKLPIGVVETGDESDRWYIQVEV